MLLCVCVSRMQLTRLLKRIIPLTKPRRNIIIFKNTKAMKRICPFSLSRMQRAVVWCETAAESIGAAHRRAAHPRVFAPKPRRVSPVTGKAAPVLFIYTRSA